MKNKRYVEGLCLIAILLAVSTLVFLVVVNVRDYGHGKQLVSGFKLFDPVRSGSSLNYGAVHQLPADLQLRVEKMSPDVNGNDCLVTVYDQVNCVIVAYATLKQQVSASDLYWLAARVERSVGRSQLYWRISNTSVIVTS